MQKKSGIFDQLQDSFQGTGWGVAVIVGVAFSFGDRQLVPEFFREVVSDLSEGSVHTGDKPSRPFFAVLIFTGFEGMIAVVQKDQHPECVAVVVQFFEGVVAVGYLINGHGQLEDVVRHGLCPHVRRPPKWRPV